CRRLLEKILKIRPNHPEALELIADTCFRLERFDEGLAYYERLRDPPDWPLVTYAAAVAALKTGRLEQCKTWIAEFLEETRGDKEYTENRRAARELAKEVDRRIKASVHLGTTKAKQMDLSASVSLKAPSGQRPPPRPS